MGGSPFADGSDKRRSFLLFGNVPLFLNQPCDYFSYDLYRFLFLLAFDVFYPKLFGKLYSILSIFI